MTRASAAVSGGIFDLLQISQDAPAPARAVWYDGDEGKPPGGEGGYANGIEKAP